MHYGSKHAEHLHVLQMAVIGARNAAMITCIAVGQKQVESLKGQLQECSLCAQKALSENCRLRQNVDALTKKLQVCTNALCDDN